VRLNSDNKINKWLKIGESITLMQSNRDRQTEGNGGVIFQALRSDPTMPVYDTTGNWSYLSRSAGNPKGVVDRNNYSYNTIRFQGSFYTEIEFLKNLKYRFNGGLDRSWGKRIDFKPAFFIAGPESNQFNTLTTENESWNNWLLENTLSYSVSAGKHKLDFLAGYTAQYEIKEYAISTVILPTDDPDMWYASAKNGLADVLDVGGGAREWALVSQLGRLNYSFADKYLLTASIRRDGSSRFGKNKKYGIFPSWSAAWKISEEKFFKSVPLLSGINFMKIRLGWGKVGNQNIVPYAYNGSVSNRPDQGRYALQTVMGLPKTAIPYYVDYTLANPDIGWETNVTTNLGIDMAAWTGKFNMSIDVYNKKTMDLLMRKQLPAYFGKLDDLFGNVYTNLGEVNNKGIEFSAGYRNYEGEFKFEIIGNIARNINKVVSLDGGQPPVIGNSTVIKEGIALGTFYGYKSEGIFKDSADIANHAFQYKFTAPGDIKYADLNKDGKIDNKDQTYIGNAFPDFNYGFTLNFFYKDFDLNIFTNGVHGNDIYNSLGQNVLRDLSMSGNLSTDMLNYWGRILPDGTKITNTNIPAIGKNMQNRYFSDLSLKDGSYFRVKAITIGYSVNNNIIQKVKISKLRIYITVQNLFTFTKYNGYDPEIGQSTGWNASPLDFGVDGGVYPQPRMILGGINISF
jgi:TonB-linked SusC/RagA family outer membrane protein